MFVTGILSTVRGIVKAGGGSLLLCIAQLSFELVNFKLQGSGILLMREVTLSPGLTSTGPDDMHTPLLISSSLMVDKTIFTLGSYGFYLLWT